ncbi:MAG: hypothetical protein ACRDXC_06590 [Acidimicrobiales bacterium]
MLGDSDRDETILDLGTGRPVAEELAVEELADEALVAEPEAVGRNDQKSGAPDVPGHAPARDAGRPRKGRAVLRGVVRRDRTLTAGGAELRVLVLACNRDDVTAVDLASRSLVRLRIPWPAGASPDLSPFDVVEATLADDPERDDLAHPEAATAAAPPLHVGALRGRRLRLMLARLATAHDDPLLGFHGPSAPYWDFHGLRPSLALVRPARGPQLLRRDADESTWVRFGWGRDDVWLPVEDEHAVRALSASRHERLAGKPLTTALGFSPHYLLVALSAPREGHCYKICAAILPKA